MQTLIVIQRLHNLYPVHHTVKCNKVICLKFHILRTAVLAVVKKCSDKLDLGIVLVPNDFP